MTTTVIPVHPVGVQLIVEGDAIARMTLNGKAWEPETRGKWHEFVQACSPSDMVLDVGAYTGVYAIASALMGMHVMAIEPHPHNYARLIMNSALNSMRIEAIPIAASSKKGIMRLHMKQRINDTASLHAGADPLCVEHIDVPVHRIDELTFRSRVGLMKIDVEYHEVDVLQGANKIIATHRPIVVVETLDDQAYVAVGLLLFAAHYRIRTVLDGRNTVYEPKERTSHV